MEIDQRIPDLSDKELENLHANALRLVESGSVKQRQQAESLLPLLGAAIQTRRAARAEADQARRKSNVRRKAAAKSAD
jgi:hypothetical protein